MLEGEGVGRRRGLLARVSAATEISENKNKKNSGCAHKCSVGNLNYLSIFRIIESRTWRTPLDTNPYALLHCTHQTRRALPGSAIFVCGD